MFIISLCLVSFYKIIGKFDRYVTAWSLNVSYSNIVATVFSFVIKN